MTVTNGELIALAIPSGVALATFKSIEDALLAMLVFGLTVGEVDGVRAGSLAAAGEDLLRSDPKVSDQFDRFLETTVVMTKAVLGE